MDGESLKDSSYYRLVERCETDCVLCREPQQGSTSVVCTFRTKMVYQTTVHLPMLATLENGSTSRTIPQEKETKETTLHLQGVEES